MVVILEQDDSLRELAEPKEDNRIRWKFRSYVAIEKKHWNVSNQMKNKLLLF